MATVNDYLKPNPHREEADADNILGYTMDANGQYTPVYKMKSHTQTPTVWADIQPYKDGFEFRRPPDELMYYVFHKGKEWEGFRSTGPTASIGALGTCRFTKLDGPQGAKAVLDNALRALAIQHKAEETAKVTLEEEKKHNESLKVAMDRDKSIKEHRKTKGA